jgi:hypothetical protein
MDIDAVGRRELSFLFNKFFFCSTQNSERPEWICTSLNRKKANAVDRAECREYNKNNILDQPLLAIGQKVRIFTRIFPSDEGFRLGNKGGWDE